MMNITSIKKERCCGCTACVFSCNKDAIVMKEDSQGFLYPVVNEALCNHCGICINVCTKKTNNHINTPIKVYAAKSKDEKILEKASSGGIAAELSRYIVSNGGVVYGVVYDDLYNVITTRIDNLEACERLFGSKYVQTDLKNVIEQVILDLREGKTVLYFGTSCHVSGLVEVLRQKKISTERLITVDFICHGVPSPRLFKEYISYLKKDTDFLGFSFRTKLRKWGNGSSQYGTSVFHINGKVETNTLRSNAFLRIFFSNNCLRPVCYGCEHVGRNKVGDFTLADYWGLREAHPDFFDERGVSAVFVNSDKGMVLFKTLDSINYIESSIEKVVKKQGNMQAASTKGVHYNDFWNDYYERGFSFVLKKYGDIGGWSKIKQIIKKMLDL